MLLKHIFLAALCSLLMFLPGTSRADTAGFQVPVLVYHRFAPTVQDSMTVRVSTFEAHLRVLRSQGYTVIPLHELLDFMHGRRSSPRQTGGDHG